MIKKCKIKLAGSEVNLPQMGNNSLKTVTDALSALALTLFGSYSVVKSGAFFKKGKRQITSVRTENKNLAEVYGEVISVLIFPRQQYCDSRL